MTTGASERAKGRLRVLGAWGLVAAPIVFARPSFAWIAAGAPLVVAGEAVRLWAAGHLLKTVEFVTAGPYRYTRNPLYLGRLLIFSGLCVMARLPFGLNGLVLLTGWAIFFGYYLPRKERVEPARLRAAHGDAYDRYHRAVPSLFPALVPYPAAQRRPWSGARCLANREPWMVLALALALLWLAGRAYSSGAG